MKQILQKMKQYVLVVLLVLMGNYGWGQTWSYDFGASTGTFTSSTASTSFLPTPTTGGGTSRVRVGTNPGSFVLANPGLSNLGSNSELQITSNTGNISTTKFSIHDFTASKVGYIKFNIVINGGTNGVYLFSIGDGTNYSDNSAIATNQIFAGIRWAIGASNTVTYNVLNNNTYGATGISNSTTLFSQSNTNIYSIEVYYNNENSSKNYSKSGTSYSISNSKWDLWINGTLIGDDLARGAQPVNTNIDSFAFNHQSSSSSPGTIYLDDIEYSNALPSNSAPTATLTPSVALTEQNLNGEILTLTLENTTFTDATLDAANFTLNNAPSGVSISGVSYTNATAAQITLAYNDTDFDTSIADFSITTAASELSAAQNLTSSSVSITAVTETLSVSAITSFGSPCLNSETTQTFTVSGANLKVGNVNLAALSGFTYSLDNSNFTPTLTIASAGGTLAATTIHVKFVPTAVQSYNGNIVVSGVGAPSQNRSVVASGINTAPTLTTPTSTSITVSSAVLGGNVTVVGCTPVTTRGIEYSTTTGFSNGTGTVVSESGTFSTGTFTVNVSGLTSGTTYYYKAFATSASGTSYTTQGTFSTLKTEPTNHPTNFVATSVTTGAIVPQWTASVAGSQAPDGYLIKASTTTVVDPVDGTDPANSLDISGGSANRKVTSGSAISGATFTSMSSGTMYNYKIYPYTNSGATIDFKITDAVGFNHATLPTAPTALTSSLVQQSAATLSWTAGIFNAGNDFLVFVKSSSAITSGSPTFAPSNYTANPIFGQGTVYQNDVNAFCVYKGDATTVNISGLNPNETYHVAVYKVVEASNSDGTNSYSTVLIGNFLTLTNPVTVPYAQDFENATTEWVLDNSGINKWSIGSATQNGGSKALYISNDGGVSNFYATNATQTTNAIIRADLSGLTNATLTFDWKSNGELFSGTVYDYGEVYINTGGSDVLISGAKEFYNTTTFAQKSIDISAYTGSIVTLKFRWVNDNFGGNQPPFAVDNVAILPYGFPSFTTSTVTSITNNSAISGATITSDGGSSITNRGIVYATTANPTTSNFVISDGSGTGTFTANLSGLLSNTTYYVRAFVTTTNGTYYANEVSFTTTNIAAPLALNATGVGATSFTATWDAVQGATGYEIDVYAIDAGTNATDLFISEYVEGSSNNKAIEIFNGTGSTVNLADYVLIQFSNGASRTSGTREAFVLSGNLNNGEVYVVSNTSSNSAILSVSDIQSGSLNFNGDDALALYNSSDVSGTTINVSAVEIDIFGVIGSDPGSAWSGTGGYATVEKTLVRKSIVLSGVSVNPTGTGSSAFTTLTTEWDLYDQDNVSNLGSHTFDGGSSNSYILQNQVVGNVTSYQVTGLDQNTTYYYVVRAKDATSESVNSNEITTTTAIVSTTYTTSWSNSAPTASIDAIINGNLTTTTDLVCKDLTINSGKTLTIGAGKKLTVSGNLINNGTIIFKSDATGTAMFDVYNGSQSSLGVTTVERYIPSGKRAFRLLSPAVTTTAFILNNWQGQTHITGGLGTTGLGFDATETNNPSMYTYNNLAPSGTGWTAIANTNNTNLTAGVGYRVLIRGNRNVNLTVASQDNMNAAITLSATGTLKTGTVTLNASSTPAINNTANTTTLGYSLVGNPYQSAVDWNAVTRSGIDATYWAWDPNMGSTSQRGRYVSFNGTVNSVIDGTGSSNVGRYIQPGQAFFVKNTTPGTEATLTFQEAHKATTNANVFRTANQTESTNFATLSTALYDPNELAIGGYPIDAMKAVFSSAYTNELGLGDATKLEAAGENIAWFRNNTKLAIDAAAPVTNSDELVMKTIRLGANKNYTFKIQTTNFDTALTPYLVDTFLNTQTEIATSQAHLASFATTSNVASYSENRFKIVFQNALLNTDTFATQVGLYPNPSKGNGFYLQLPSTAHATVRLYNTLGQEIAISHNEGHYQANQSLAAGVYHIMVTQGEKTSKLKWIVE